MAALVMNSGTVLELGLACLHLHLPRSVLGEASVSGVNLVCFKKQNFIGC